MPVTSPRRPAKAHIRLRGVLTEPPEVVAPVPNRAMPTLRLRLRVESLARSRAPLTVNCAVWHPDIVAVTRGLRFWACTCSKVTLWNCPPLFCPASDMMLVSEEGKEWTDVYSDPWC